VIVPTHLRSLRDALLLCALATLFLPAPAHAQFGKRLKDAMKQRAERKAIEKATDAESDGIDALTAPGAQDTSGSAASAVADTQPAPTAAPVSTPTRATGAPISTAPPTLWVNDFVPGDRVIFDTDYAEDDVGNFPKRLKFVSGNMEVAELDGRRLLRATSPSVFTISLPETLPERFTIEIEVINRPTLGHQNLHHRLGHQRPGADWWGRGGSAADIRRGEPGPLPWQAGPGAHPG
jgi:OOP family OmpA-OmpF porin